MGDRSHDGPGLTVREGRPDDAPFVVGLGADAFARFGDYGPIMREFLGSPDVASFIAEAAGERVGFALVEAPLTRPGFKDLVAIVPVGDVALLRAIEDRMDLDLIRQRKREPSIPWKNVKSDLGL